MYVCVFFLFFVLFALCPLWGPLPVRLYVGTRCSGLVWGQIFGGAKKAGRSERRGGGGVRGMKSAYVVRWATPHRSRHRRRRLTYMYERNYAVNCRTYSKQSSMYGLVLCFTAAVRGTHVCIFFTTTWYYFHVQLVYK